MNDTTQKMIERLLSEGDKLGMVAAGELLGENQGGTPIHPATVSRWCMKGVRIAGGQRLRLEHMRVGGKIITTRAAIVRFVAAQTEAPEPAPALRTPTQRRHAAEQAAAELERMGI